MTPTDKTMTVDALKSAIQGYKDGSCRWDWVLDCIEQYGRKRETSGFECGVLAEFKATERQAGRGSGEPVGWASRDMLAVVHESMLPVKMHLSRHETPAFNVAVFTEPQQSREPLTDEQMASKFHEAYERLAPAFGYETRPDTKAFDPESPNGKLMIAVCREIAHNIRSEG